MVSERNSRLASVATQRQTDTSDDLVPIVLFPSRIVDQHAMDHPGRKIAPIIEDLVARNCEKSRRYALVLNARRWMLLR